MQLNQLAPVPTYYSPAQQSLVGPNMQTYQSLANSAAAERQQMMQRAADRQNAVLGGYGQMIQNNRLLGDQALTAMGSDYDRVAQDAAATRDRNMARVDQYGNSMRQDLDIQRQQQLAAAQYGAIKRGLGNTTITDSLARGVNFDNQRQRLSLEDQLLQNRIATDSNLSGTYQQALANRAGALANQRNQNIGTENQLGSARLGYLGGIQDDTQSFNTVSNLYTQMWAAQDAAYQADQDRRAQNPQAYSTNPYGIVLGRTRTAWL